MLLSLVLLTIQFLLLAAFCYFAFFKYLYGFASLKPAQLPRTAVSGKQCAVVIVAFNERHVIEDTIKACDALTYQSKLIVLADDSNDPSIVQRRIAYAKQRGCQKLTGHKFSERVVSENGEESVQPIEIWESQGFVLIQRPANTGFKAGSLNKVHQYLESRGIKVIYLLDADWHPQNDALERAFEILEANNNLAFVQTKRVAQPNGMNLFQKITSIMEETCYFVDFQGRQSVGHPVLFSGCCALMRLDVIRRVGGFNPGQLTEDLDLSNRLWLAGCKGAYAADIINYGEVPFAYDDFRRQQARWSTGTTAALRNYFLQVLRSSNLRTMEKLSIVRQNSYFFCNFFAILAFLVGIFTVSWVIIGWNSFAVEYYLYIMQICQIPIVILIYMCVMSTLLGPILMIAFHKRRFSDLIYIPLAVWYAASIVSTYLIGNLNGFFHRQTEWFRTPKYCRAGFIQHVTQPIATKILNQIVLGIVALFYFVEGWAFGWIDLFAMLWIPALIIASTE